MTMLGNLKYTPYRDSGNLATFIIRPATVFEKVRFEAEIAGSPYYSAEPRAWLFGEEIDNFMTLRLDGDALIGARDAVAAVRADIADVEQQALAEAIEAKARLYHKPYRDLVDQAARRQTFIPYIATRNFLIGWENRKDEEGNDIPFTLDDDKVSEASMATLNEYDLMLVGFTAYKFMRLNESERKNFISAALSTPTPQPTTSGNTTLGADSDGTSA